MIAARRSSILCLMVLLGFATLRAQDLLTRVRELYESAAYEEALTTLDAMPEAQPAEQQVTRWYRALCLLALSRAPEAEDMMAKIIAADPLYKPAAEKTPPRVLTTFARVRALTLPSLAADRYSKAKEDYENDRYAEAETGFELALRIVDDMSTDSSELASDLTDIRLLARGFLYLSRTARERQALTTRTAADAVSDSNNADVSPPITIRQTIPSWTPNVRRVQGQSLNGQLEVIIDTNGHVQSASILASIDPVFDRLLLDETKKWAYKPARKGGQSVMYRKVIDIRVSSAETVSAK